MNWLSRFLPGASSGAASLGAAQQAALAALAQRPAPDLGRAHFETRYVVLNCEAAALPSGGQRLHAVAAVALNQGLLHPADAFRVELGAAPADALLRLLDFVGRAPVVVFNAGFNRSALERAFEEFLGEIPGLDWLDLAVLLPSLLPDRTNGRNDMDAWLAAWEIERLDRRQALLEALAVAQLLQVALARASHGGMPTPRDLIDAESNRRWLRG